jgi:hypothetical protein
MPMTMDERLDHARAALTAYFEAKGEPLPEGPWDYEDTDASDLIADLLHLQRRLGLRDTQPTIDTALMHFEAEEEEGPFYPCALCKVVTDEPVCSDRCQTVRGYSEAGGAHG